MRKIICAFCLFLCACREKPTLPGQEFHILQNGLEITLAFGAHDNHYYGKAVNSYYGTYQLQGDSIRFGNPASTMYSSDEQDLHTEEVFLDTLSHIQRYHLTETTLTLTDDTNHSLTFQK